MKILQARRALDCVFRLTGQPLSAARPAAGRGGGEVPGVRASGLAPGKRQRALPLTHKFNHPRTAKNAGELPAVCSLNWRLQSQLVPAVNRCPSPRPFSRQRVYVGFASVPRLRGEGDSCASRSRLRDWLLPRELLAPNHPEIVVPLRSLAPLAGKGSG